MVDVDERKPSDFENISPLGSVPLLQDGDLNIYGRYLVLYSSFTSLGSKIL